MVFASLTFLYIFLPLNILLYFLSKNSRYRNIILILFSLIFYAWGEPVYIFLLIASATVDYYNGLFIDRFRQTKWAKIGIISTLIFNIGLLATFKYLDFIYENINSIFGTHFVPAGLALPIGISFYTFQTISYVLDVYWDKVPVQRSWSKFMLFVSLYHQLVAGPIVRYAHISSEINNRKFDIIDISKGIFRFCIGLFKKIAIANVAGEFVAIYLDGSIANLTTAEAWFGILMFAIQIYFDFSGYSDMAIGLGQIFGFHYHENFNYPYISKSATEFWRRWHISLGSFFKDYLYIPLGGNKKNAYFNLFIVWFLTGLWHGASWNFVLWGLYFGLAIAIERLFLFKLLNYLPKIFSHFYLLFMVLMGWVLFYFTDLKRLISFFKSLFSSSNGLYNTPFLQTITENSYWLFLVITLSLPSFIWVKNILERSFFANKRDLVWSLMIFASVLLLLTSTVLLVGKSYNPFIYYRF